MKTRCCTSRRARSGRGARPAAWCGLTSRRCAAARARRTTTWKSPRSSTRCCCRMCPICRCAWRRGAALYLAGGCAVRPARQAHHVGRRAARAAVHRRPAGPRVSAHGVAPERNAVQGIPGAGAATRQATPRQPKSAPAPSGDPRAHAQQQQRAQAEKAQRRTALQEQAAERRRARLEKEEVARQRKAQRDARRAEEANRGRSRAAALPAASAAQ
jgi:hypothetical protein